MTCPLLTRVLMFTCTYMYIIQIATLAASDDVTIITEYETEVVSTTLRDMESTESMVVATEPIADNATEQSSMTTGTGGVTISGPTTTTNKNESTSNYVTNNHTVVVTTQSPNTVTDGTSRDQSSTINDTLTQQPSTAPTSITTGKTTSQTPTNGVVTTPSPSTDPNGTSTEQSSITPTTITTMATEPHSPTPAYPAETYPDISGTGSAGTIFRELQVEVAVIYEACDPSKPSTEKECTKLEENFKIYAELKYNNVSGFSNVDIANLSIGSVIITHNVFYKYNEMTASDKQLSADEIYGKTLAPSVEGKDTEYGFTFTECNKCEVAKDLSNLCDPDSYHVDCDVGEEASCADNVWVCQSPCARTDNFYCTAKSAFCTQGQLDATPTCKCEQSENGWYIGAQCQVYINRLGLIIGTSIGGGLILILLIILSICLRRAKKDLNELRKLPYEKTNEAFLLGRNELELEQIERTNDYNNKAFSHEVQPGELDDSFRPNTGRPVSNQELEQTLQERARQADKNRSSQNMPNKFWGNLVNDEIKGPNGNTPASQNQVKRQSKSYSEKKESKPIVASRHGKNVQPSTHQLPDNETASSDPFSNRYSKIIKDDYGGLNNH